MMCITILSSGDRCDRCALRDGKQHVCNVDVYGAYCKWDSSGNARCVCPNGYSSELRDCDPNGKFCKGYCVVSI